MKQGPEVGVRRHQGGHRRLPVHHPRDRLGLCRCLISDNGGEFINYALIKWVDEKDIYFTRSRPYKSNDNAHVEQKNGDVVRRHAFHYRYDTAAELKLLNALYALVRVRLNLFTASTKATGWRSNKHGKKTRIYDKPQTRTNPSSIPESSQKPKPLNSRH
ncbi:hypothetical protein QK285_05865 [Pseudarthrobacter sp. AL20]|uniref:hypothetical protein n=1 Tax=Pseudarthrobacter sp. AL20 TaxID=3042239 RepID=UPI00249CCF7E|nr:hypothetical protein [Pseudarthrobacter sp. AL20]MDI3193987.1 hypothetical protein [Pseudarthrobacter sp. AL20]